MVATCQLPHSNRSQRLHEHEPEWRLSCGIRSVRYIHVGKTNRQFVASRAKSFAPSGIQRWPGLRGEIPSSLRLRGKRGGTGSTAETSSPIGVNGACWARRPTPQRRWSGSTGGSLIGSAGKRGHQVGDGLVVPVLLLCGTEAVVQVGPELALLTGVKAAPGHDGRVDRAGAVGGREDPAPPLEEKSGSCPGPYGLTRPFDGPVPG